MTNDRRPADADQLGDATIEQLVREVAGGWTMPPVRLDVPGWRERVRPARARRLAAMRGGLGRALRAATAAIALTVAGALVAVMLTQPPLPPGSSPDASPGTTPPAQATALPRLLVNGDLPDVVSLLVSLERGAFATVDLASGTMGAALAGADDGSLFRRERDGTLLCLCLTRSRDVGQEPTQVDVNLVRYDAAGSTITTRPIRSFIGEPDPRDQGQADIARLPHVLVGVSFAADARFAFIGWSARSHPAWHGGIVVVDLADGSVVSTLGMPDGQAGSDEVRRVVDAPRVAGETRPGTFVIARSWYAWTPGVLDDDTFDYGVDAFSGAFGAGSWTGVEPLPAAADCGRVIERAGPTADGGTWLACKPGGPVVRRLSADGSALGDVRLQAESGLDDGTTTALSPDGRFLYAWHPATASVHRVDLASGQVEIGRAPLSQARTDGPLAGLGAWLAPPVAAKVFLRGAMVLSPDGSRVYAIGVRGPSGEGEFGGSTGVFVFDAITLAPLDRWEPTSDFASLAVSSSGRFVYAAGLPGFEADGAGRPSRQASVTVFDAADGSVRLIAGALGLETLSFPGSTLD